jgi:hypothetical protein
MFGKYSVNNLICEFVQNKDKIHAFATGKCVESYNGNNEDDNKILGLSIGLFLIIFAIALAIWIWALVALIQNWNRLSDLVKIIALVTLLGVGGPVVTLIIVYVMRNGNGKPSSVEVPMKNLKYKMNLGAGGGGGGAPPFGPDAVIQPPSWTRNTRSTEQPTDLYNFDIPTGQSTFKVWTKHKIFDYDWEKFKELHPDLVHEATHEIGPDGTEVPKYMSSASEIPWPYTPEHHKVGPYDPKKDMSLRNDDGCTIS